MYACEIKYLGSNPLIKANSFGERPKNTATQVFILAREMCKYKNKMNSRIIIYSTGKHLQYPVTNHSGKKYKKECI